MASNSKELHKTPHETNWVVHITQLLQPNTLQTALQTPTSIFKLPHSITNGMPQAYFPRHIALGPYHHFTNKLYQMELHKLDNAINAIESFKLPQLHQIAADLEQFDIKIRSCYDKFLDFGSETLAWIMLLDGLFLVQILAISNDETNERRRSYPELYFPYPFPSFIEQKLYCSLIEANLMTQNELVNDVLKLENQIPIFVLKKILPQNFGNNLHILFFKFCEVISPKKLPPHDLIEFKRYKDSTDVYQILEQSHHLLHFLYLLILDTSSHIRGPCEMADSGGYLFLDFFSVFVSVLQIPTLQQLSEAVGLIQALFGLHGRVWSSCSSTGQDRNSPWLIPSAEQLRRVGVLLNGNDKAFHKSIRFEKERPEPWFKLPTITINAFSEVVFRNLVAFEAATKLNPPYFSNYVVLMSGLITTIKDVKILKEGSIIESHAGSEEEVVKLFDGLRSVLELKNMAELQMVKDINSYYESCWKVKVKRFIQKYINPMLKVIVLIVVILLIGVVVVRMFCRWFGCFRILHVVSPIIMDNYQNFL
ncbi:putative UPF0481 protein At3g02645 [Cucurbita moschata]|uniref:UPF0481 protein At3g02645 n=1 Tax=Cucurbita moschata TaxID=3662 RepID=A0A6J1EC80_CUCMO|nr:putative UPF0481 protein At3g02645 [Cucurbita moschata]